MDENNQAVNMADHVLGFDPEQVERLPFKELLTKVGPGFHFSGYSAWPGVPD